MLISQKCTLTVKKGKLELFKLLSIVIIKFAREKPISVVKRKTVKRTRNKEQVGKHRIDPTCEAFSYCEYSSFIKLSSGKHQHCVIASFYNIAESLIASSVCTVRTSNKKTSW